MTTQTLLIPEESASSFQQVANPRRDIWIGAIVAVLFFVIFLGWAAFARLDAAAFAHGVLEVSGERQAVQHRDGGVVGAIHVTEGQQVRQGQLLIELSAPEVRAQERGLQAQEIELLAQESRLLAEQLDLPAMQRPAEFATLTGADRASADAAFARQVTEMRARRAVLGAQLSTLNERVGQSGDMGRGYNEQQRSATEQVRLIDEELKALAPLDAEGFVSKTRIRELERMRADMTGREGQYAASVAQTRGQASENQLQKLEAERSFHERSAADLRDVDTRLADVRPKLRAAREQLARTEIRAPATGAVVGLIVYTPGGVINPGQKLMDIVPARRPLRIEARFSPDDADDLVVGARTLVRMPGLHERKLPDLAGTLTRLSADKFTDERTSAGLFHRRGSPCRLSSSTSSSRCAARTSSCGRACRWKSSFRCASGPRSTIWWSRCSARSGQASGSIEGGAQRGGPRRPSDAAAFSSWCRRSRRETRPAPTSP